MTQLSADDLMHPNTGEENYNESAYYNFYDPARRLGGFARIGNRPNERHAEMTLCLYLPDGRVAFMFARPEIADDARFDAAGMRFEVRVPMREHRVLYDSPCVLLTRPLDLVDPKRAFTENPHRGVEVDLIYEGISPAYGGEPRERREGSWVSVRHERTGHEFARGHLEQHGRARGRVVVDGVDHPIDGFGLRDRSWGPRYWQAPAYYRWLTMNFGPDHGLVGALTVQRDGTEMHGGYVYRRGARGLPRASARRRGERQRAPPPARRRLARDLAVHAGDARRRGRAPRPSPRPAGPRHRDEPPPGVPAAPRGGGRRRAGAARAL